MTSINEINKTFKKYNGAINKKDIQKIIEYSKYKSFSGNEDKTVNSSKRAILRVRTLINKPFRYWTQADALNAYYQIYDIPLYLMHKKEFRGMLLCDVLEIIKNTDYKRIKDNTARKIIETIKTFLNWLVNGGYVKKNVFDGINPKRDIQKPNSQKEAFDKIKIKRIFNDDFFHNKINARNGKYWVTILAATVGARQGELAQLHKVDISYKSGCWYLSINKDHKGKRIKNKYAIREIPIPKHLIRLGFIDFVKSVESGHLFKDIKYNESDGYGRTVSRWFSSKKSKWLEVDDDPRKYDFHSFRHYVINNMKQGDVNVCLVSEITGHTYNSMAFERYGKDFSLKKKKKILDKFTSKHIKNLPRIYPKKGFIERLFDLFK
ncbi:TPA: site-specific integrase [Vibrio parahaemolyticus]|nr:site-specific integrase [Vibrio parahaemolyticus]